MPVYRTEFERINFDFDPPLYQKADVVFESEFPYDDDHVSKIDAAAWNAMWEQNPQWKDPSSPLEGYSGWSSVLGGRKITEVVDKDLDFDLGEPSIGLPRIAETFTRKGEDNHNGLYDRSYRVTGFYKTYISKKKSGNEMLDEMLAEIVAEEHAAMTATERKRKDEMIKIVSCHRDEAEFVSGAGVGGCICRIEDCIITGRVNWEIRTIARYRRDYNKKNFEKDTWPIEIWKYWGNE